jgi:glycosyltransferase involved in cell wall biosynthesis
LKPSALLIINELHSGGAERTLIEVACGLRDDFDLEVIALRSGGPADDELRAAGIRTTLLHGATAFAQLRAWWQLAGLMRRRRPHVILSFLYLADFAAALLAPLCARRAPVYWNIRNNLMSREQMGAASGFACRANARLSGRVPRAIVYCSSLARTQHEAIGYDARRGAVVPNSPAAVPFGFSAAKRARLRAAREDDAFTFLFIGRYTPVKRVEVFLAACAAVARAVPGPLRVLLAGRGMDAANVQLVREIAAGGLGARVELLGHHDDPQALYSAADCLVVTSESEGSPNAVYEAMATQLPAIIYGTLGTEGLAAPGILRLPQRDFATLVAAMVEAARRGAAERHETPGGARAPHPLLEYYRRELQVTGPAP